MAYTKIYNCRLRLEIENGTNEKGEKIYRSFTLPYSGSQTIVNYAAREIYEIALQFMKVLKPTDGKIYMDGDNKIYS